MPKKNRPNIRYYSNLNPLPGGEKDRRIWVVTLDAENMREFRRSCAEKAIRLKQIPKNQVALSMGGGWEPQIVDKHWSLARKAPATMPVY